MIIHNFDIESVAFTPLETDPPLVINADAVLTRSITAKQLKTIGRRDAQVLQGDCTIQHTQLAESHLLHVVREFPRESAPEYLLRLFALERPDHNDLRITLHVMNVKDVRVAFTGFVAP
jgi:hypothetical protein